LNKNDKAEIIQSLTKDIPMNNVQLNGNGTNT